MNYIEKTQGITTASKRFVVENITKIGGIRSVEISWNQQEVEYVTKIIGTDGTIIVTGFSLGYSGEGPHGLEWLLKLLNISFKIQDIFSKVTDKGVKRWNVSFCN